MNRRAASNRTVMLAVLSIWLLVCGGLGWATWAAVELERHRAEDVQKRLHEHTLAFVREQVNDHIDAVLGQERLRPVVEYRAFYKQLVYEEALPEAREREPKYLESPLRDIQVPHTLVHFQGSQTSGWSSPQVAAAADFATPASAIPAEERPKSASAANWLAALRERFEPYDLQELYQEALNAEAEKQQVLLGENSGLAPAAEESDPGLDDSDLSGASLTALEFARRGYRLLQLQRQYLPMDRCISAPVVIENLQFGEEARVPAGDALGCVVVTALPMLPIWLDLTLDGEKQLALVRSVSAEGYFFCTLQGVLVDWRQLRRALEEDIQALLPGARIEPVFVGARWQPDMLEYIPARLVRPAPALGASAPPPTRLRWGLALTWGVTALALLAITYGAIKYVGMAGRRMRFAAAVTHELRTPLTSFQIYTDLLADLASADEPRRRQYIETLRKESKRLARLVENVLAYSKIGDTRAALNPESVEPRRLLDSVAAETAEQCRASGKQLIVENHCRGDARIRTDREFVMQILANLVDNACRHSAGAADPRIWLTAQHAAGDEVVFEVEDCGAGVPPGDRRAVFEPFRQAARTDGSRTGGLGLGLALSRYWAACLGGRLVLKRGDRNGAHFSRFALSLPLG